MRKNSNISKWEQLFWSHTEEYQESIRLNAKEPGLALWMHPSPCL